MSKSTNIREFAERVERLCDFLLSKKRDEGHVDGSDDIRVIQDLKEEAADIHMKGSVPTEETLEGLAAYMKGM